jgi:cysteine synthase
LHVFKLLSVVIPLLLVGEVAGAMGASIQLVERLRCAERIIRETPVVELRDDRVVLFAKLEFHNGIGSIKEKRSPAIRQKLTNGADV